MSWAHRILKAVASDRTVAAMEAETRRWTVECTTCGNKRDLWDLGGIKYKAHGTSYTVGKCPDCDRRRALKIWKSG